MFILHTSNKTENLLEHLHQVLLKRLSAPLLKEQFMIQSQGMQRWLSQQLAEKKGVWANFEFYFPGKFFGEIVDEVMTELQLQADQSTEIFSQDYLLWHFDRLLRNLEGDEFAVLHQYMQGESVDLKRYQLAEKLAYLFDQYQFMRPDWLMAWVQGKSCLSTKEEKWQSLLWRQLQDDYKVTSKGQLWLMVIEKLAAMDNDKVKKLLPERLCVFGINAMSPIYLKFLETIGQFTDVHLFLLNPVEGYWADIATKRQLAKQMAVNELDNQDLDDENREVFFEIDNPLLAALGQQGRDFQQLLLEQTEFELSFNSFESYGKNNTSVLTQLQDDILNNTSSDKNEKRLTTDNTISIHACHSRMREIEVLKDQLLKCLDENLDISLRDIVIMSPDISVYAPYVSAVFEDIPHAIADRNMLDNNDPLSVFLRFLSLSQNRWELESVFEILEQAVVYQKFSLLEADLEIIRTWIDNTQVRWGESADHRQQLGFPAFTENSWQAGLQRMLMGYVNADDSEFCDNVLPFSELEGSQAQALGGLYDFFNLLSQTKKTFADDHTLEYWVKHLEKLANQLLDVSDEFQHSYSSLMLLIEKLTDFKQIHQEKISLNVMLAWLTTTATNQQSGAGFLRGQLTFCSMLPMRAIPFKVIALIGMNEGEYPRVENRPEFDLMANNFRKGDKSPRVDERYQLLEVLLSAQQQLIITYIGQSQRNNAIIPASVVVTELLEVLDEYYDLDKASLLTLHPLQAHSRQYFTESDQLFSYSAHHYAVTNALVNRQQNELMPWWSGETNNNEQERIIELADFLSFYRNPQRYFLVNQLQLSIPSMDSRVDETELFKLDGLLKYQIEQEWVEREMKDDSGSSLDEFYHRLMAQGRWLSGNGGIIAFDDQRLEVEQFAGRVKSISVGNQVDPLFVDLRVGEYRIVGSLAQQYEAGTLYYRYANLKGKDLLPAWISHLLASQMGTHQTWLVCKNDKWLFQKVDDSIHILTQLVEHYIQGSLSPSPFLLDPAIAWQAQKNNKRSRSLPKEKALSVYKGIIPYHSELQLIYQDQTPESVIDDRFEQTCELLTPIWLTRESSIH